MKTLNKQDFVKFLKIISVTLDKADIKHEIPFCHIDKMEWNYINIIIPDFISDFDLMKILNVNQAKEKNGIIYTIVDDFDVRFIKSNEKVWSYSLYYYSWDIIHILINILTDQFSMIYTKTGLYYKYGEDKNILLSTNLKDVFDFLDLPFHMITNGFPTEYVMYNFIESSTYFNADDFTLEKFKEIDNYYEHNIKYYENLIAHKPDIEIIKATIEEQIAIIDAFFPESNFVKKLTKIQMLENYPNLKEKDNIFIEKKSVDSLIKDKAEKIQKNKLKKKINLSNIFNKNYDNDNPEYIFTD